jgi:hypothetical protein
VGTGKDEKEGCMFKGVCHRRRFSPAFRFARPISLGLAPGTRTHKTGVKESEGRASGWMCSGRPACMRAGATSCSPEPPSQQRKMRCLVERGASVIDRRSVHMRANSILAEIECRGPAVPSSGEDVDVAS